MLTGKTNEEKIWNFLVGKGLSKAGAAGLMGNLYAESGLNPQNLQNSYEQKLGHTDSSYTAAVDCGSYQNFVRDSAGYGLSQWTYWSRKQNMLDFARAAGKSIGDLEMQLDFLFQELSDGYRTVLNELKTATSVRAASDAVLLNYERPADQSEAVKKKRAGFGQTYFDRYAKTAGKEGNTMSNSSLVSYTKISPNKSSPRNHKIDTITIHCVVGQCSVETLGSIFAPSSRQASSNYGVGVDGRIGMYVEEKDRSWCSSNAANDNRAITIEVASDTTHPYAVNDKAYAALLDLVTDICKRNGIKKLVWSTSKSDRVNHKNGCNMTVHRDYANKSCPGDYLYNRHGEIAAEVNRRLGANNPEPATPSKPAVNADVNVGDTVDFKGSKHYVSSTAKSGSTCKPGKAKVTAVAKGAAHPYHLQAVKGGGSTVYGWVDAVDIAVSVASSYRVQVSISDLRIRSGPGTNYGSKGYIKPGVYTIIEEASGSGATKWGKLKSGAGWISLDYCKKV